jgi:type II secretory pathway pseudopilin PulG
MRHGYFRQLCYWAACATMFLLTPLCVSQTNSSQKKEPMTPQLALSNELAKYPGLLPELVNLLDKLKQVQFPPERQQSNLLPLLPPSTTYYIGLPNYGEAAHQALTIFHEELKSSPVLRNWWNQGDMAKSGAQIESSVDKFYELSQYLGDEWVFDGEIVNHDVKASSSKLIFVAELRKPGLKEFLGKMLKELPTPPNTDIRVMDPAELATAKDEGGANGKSGPLIILVRPDFVLAGSDVNALRSFSGHLDAKTKTAEFASTPFGARLVQTYQGGASALAAVDLHKLITLYTPPNQAAQKAFERSGFNDVKYVVWDHKNVAGVPVGEMELSFAAPRHGAAAWLVAPAPHGSLDFVSTKSSIVVSVLLKNLAEVFDDIQDFSGDSNPKAFGPLSQMEQAMHVSFRDDVLSQFQGEITFAADDLSATPPQWTSVFRIVDSGRLQQALDKLLLSAPVIAKKSDEEGITYHSIMVPAAQKPLQIVYAFVDGYLIVASSHEPAVEAVRLHKSGESLAKSANFLASLPPGYSREASALLYENGSMMTGFRLRQFSPELAEALSHRTPPPGPIVFCAYAEDKAIRGISAGGHADASAILIAAAFALPNLVRARGVANESAAVSTLRIVNTAQITYAATYLQNGYARELTALGPDPHGSGLKTRNHAGLIDADLGNPSCTAGAWCEKSGYRFSVTGVCQLRSCDEFVAVATPASASTGARSFCSTSDAVIRFQAGPALISPISAEECKRWMPLR